MAYGRREPRGAGAVTEDDLRAAAAAIARALEDPEVERGSAAALLDGLDAPPAVREAIRSRVEVSTAARAQDVGADELAGVAAFSDAPSHGIAGGNQSLARALAAGLDAAPVEPGDAHRRARRRRDASTSGVVVDAVVIAVPAPLVVDDRFEGLPPRLLEAVARRPLRARRQAVRPAARAAGAERGAVGARALLDVDRAGRRGRAAGGQRVRGLTARARRPRRGRRPGSLARVDRGRCGRTWRSLPTTSCSRRGRTIRGRAGRTPCTRRAATIRRSRSATAASCSPASTPPATSRR